MEGTVIYNELDDNILTIDLKVINLCLQFINLTLCLNKLWSMACVALCYNLLFGNLSMLTSNSESCNIDDRNSSSKL